MTLKQWAANGWLRDHRSSAEEIGNLLAIVERDLKWDWGTSYIAPVKKKVDADKLQ